MDCVVYDYNHRYNEELGHNEFIIDYFCHYFLENLQPAFEIDGQKYYEGGGVAKRFLYENDLCKYFTENGEEFGKWAKDDILNSIHKELTGNGMKLCPFNFYILCKYILEIIKDQYFVLLKPTIADTLAEIKKVKSITFTNEDGTATTSTNTELIKMVLDNIKDNNTGHYEIEKIVPIKKMVDKTLIQASFTYNIALFLKEYFKDYPRRSNCCMVSAKEQELILYMLYFFGLAPAPNLNLSRFRQLIKHYKEHRDRVSICNLPNIGLVYMEMIKYKDWKDGTIKLDKIEALKEGETVTFVSI